MMHVMGVWHGLSVLYGMIGLGSDQLIYIYISFSSQLHTLLSRVRTRHCLFIYAS